MTRTCRSWTSSRTSVPVRVRPTPMWCRRPLTRRGDAAGLVDPVVAESVVSVARSVAAGGGLGAGGVGGRGGGPVRQRSVRAVVVVGGDEGVDEGLQPGDAGRLVGLG